MYVLGIEAATPVASVAVAGQGGILAERMVLNRRTHSVNLLPMLKAVLEEAEIDKSQLTGIAVSSGPGSFTGLRIGMSTAKALAWVWRLQVVGISTLQSLAYPLSGGEGLVCPILNARKNQVYAAIYECRNGMLDCIVAPMAISPQQLAEQLLTLQRPVLFLGDGVPVYKEQLTGVLGSRAVLAPLAASYPRGAAVAELGLEAFQAGRGIDPAALQPEYIRPSEAELNWLKKNCSGG